MMEFVSSGAASTELGGSHGKRQYVLDRRGGRRKSSSNTVRTCNLCLSNDKGVGMVVAVSRPVIQYEPVTCVYGRRKSSSKTVRTFAFVYDRRKSSSNTVRACILYLWSP